MTLMTLTVGAECEGVKGRDMTLGEACGISQLRASRYVQACCQAYLCIPLLPSLLLLPIRGTGKPERNWGQRLPLSHPSIPHYLLYIPFSSHYSLFPPPHPSLPP